MKAFPNSLQPAHGMYEGGMNLRDYFAAKAMQADIYTVTSDGIFDEDHFDMDNIAERAYAMADAMLRERNNEQV